MQLRTVDDDPDGHPVLLVRLGDAARESAEGMKQVAEAIISHVEWAVEQRLSDDPGLPEQLVVVADCSGASSFQVFIYAFFIAYLYVEVSNQPPNMFLPRAHAARF